MSLSRKFLRELLESPEGQRRITEIWDEVSTKRIQEIYVPSREVKYSKDGSKDVRIRQLQIKHEIYPLKDALAFLGFAAAYGVGKPPEEKKVEINVTAGKPVHELSLAEAEAELKQIEEAEYRELPAGD